VGLSERSKAGELRVEVVEVLIRLLGKPSVFVRGLLLLEVVPENEV
jgi:hypothetical protein